MIVEVCANSLQSAINAEEAGADRIELCVELGVGGVTPSYGLIKSAVEILSIPVHVLIRPRSGDFTYSNTDFKVMLSNIEMCKKLGVSGVVSGVLTKELEVDMERTSLLKQAARELIFTFHRAFDWVGDPYQALNALEEIGVDCLLSSGQQKSALEGLDLLKGLNSKATKCRIMPGSGINSSNTLLFKESGFTAIHLSGVQIKTAMERKPTVGMFTKTFLQDDIVVESDVVVIKKVVQIVK